jgi:hypothetical protein
MNCWTGEWTWRLQTALCDSVQRAIVEHQKVAFMWHGDNISTACKTHTRAQGAPGTNNVSHQENADKCLLFLHLPETLKPLRL